MIEIDDLSFAYGAMRMRFSLCVRPKECLALIGPSGAGKSTLLSLIAGFETPLDGRVSVDGVDVGAMRPDQRPMTTLFQEHNLFSHLSVEQNIGLALHPGLKLTSAHRREIDEALERVDLAGLNRRFPAALSGGQRQRVALARTLARRKPVLLLDEPFSALDPPLRRSMLDLVNDIRRDRGLTIIMVSHLPDDAAQIAERTAFIDAGEVVGVYETSLLFSDTPPPEIAGYMFRPAK
ncbi:MAG: thiamine ABC transporter ATP-binding protein [Proteobacteria bacterium]|nr:thiamine ABC transporter ATP-binding protein [Pseudomonadota bacterium]MDA1309413.1 thiamine ABC transporter ATP-binding protein [Pseudomonadota bacterium]